MNFELTSPRAEAMQAWRVDVEGEAGTESFAVSEVSLDGALWECREFHRRELQGAKAIKISLADA